MKGEEQSRSLFGISLTNRPKWKQFSFALLASSLGTLLMAFVRSMYTIGFDSVIGLILFTLADANSSPNFSVIGVVMVCGSLIMNAFWGNLQEAIFTINPNTTQMEMLFCSTLVGLPFLVPPMVLTGELFKAWHSCYKHPYVCGVLLFEAEATYVGQVSVLSLIALFGAATTAMIKTARKAVTLLFSYIIFTKPLTGQHGSGLILIAMGVILKMVPIIRFLDTGNSQK